MVRGGFFVFFHFGKKKEANFDYTLKK